MTNKIIGIGNAIVDFLAKAEDNFLQKFEVEKGSMRLIDEDFVAKLSNLSIEKFSSGGSVGNAIATLAQLGNEVDFIGVVGADETGKKFIDDIEKSGAIFNGKILSNQKTASSFILVTPDAQRTMLTHLGCASKIEESHFNQNDFINAKILYIEGYLWDASQTILALKKSIDLAKKNNVKIAFSLSDSFCVERHHEDFLNLIKNDVDILFANEVEALKLAQLESFNQENLQQFFIKLNPNIIVVLTRSEKGCIIINKDKILEISTKKIEKIVDTTGAGDNFASGFLYYFVRNFDLQKCGEFGNFLAGKIIQKFGARFDSSEIKLLK
jgi:sugar/nucleoside kinase (ribokinase family)